MWILMNILTSNFNSAQKSAYHTMKSSIITSSESFLGQIVELDDLRANM